MRTRILWTLSLLFSVAALAGSGRHHDSARHRGHHDSDRHRAPTASGILQAFDTMYGVDGPFVGDLFPIRGIPGDELPWEIDEGKGTLDKDGHLTIKVRGLVFKDDPIVPPELRGINDEAQFRGAVSCWTEEGDQVTTQNLITQGFPATPTGNASIRATVVLPNPCVAPIVMVLAGSEEKWFAVVGVETEEEDEP